MTAPPVIPTVQAAKPFEPINAKPAAPSFANFPAPAWESWKPGVERGEPAPPQPQQPQQPQQPSANGNDFWKLFNSIWKPSKPRAPSLFQSSSLAKQPQYPRIQAEPMQTKAASSMVQYQNNNNRPFQAQTSSFQLGINRPPMANFIVSSETAPGTYQGQLNALNNGEDSSYLFIDGKPYVIRRVINRFSNTFTPGNLNVGRFQPFPRFGPGFMRGDSIPHVVRQALLDSPLRKAPVPLNSAPNQRSSMQLPVARQQQIVPPHSPQRAKIPVKSLPAPSVASQRFRVIKPNYMQIYSNYLRTRARAEASRRHLLATNINSGWPAPNRLAFRNPQQNAPRFLYSKEQTRAKPVQKQSVRAGNRYAISIKGIPGSSALAAIRNKAVTNPGFLSELLSSRTFQPNHPGPGIAQLGPRRDNVLGSVRRPLFDRNYVNNRRAMLANLPQTGRALIRTKIVRPKIWGKQMIRPTTTRTNIAYLPQSAFNRLPSWYRPKIGSALVKYVVKTKNVPQTGLDIANKKQSMMRPAAKDIWQRIYSYYNGKNAHPVRSMQAMSKERPRVLFTKSMNSITGSQGKGIVMESVPKAVNVGSPLIRMRNYQRNDKMINAIKSNEPFRLRINTGLHTGMNTGMNTFANETPKKEAGTASNFSPEMWDKRSHIESFLISKKDTIPHRPTIAGNWGTLKKKRSVKRRRRRRVNKNIRAKKGQPGSASKTNNLVF